MKKLLVIGIAAILLACTASGPQKALNNLAKAMDENNPQAFLDQIDMNAYANTYLQTMTRNDQALNSLNALGKLLGIGSIDQLIGSVVDIKAKLQDHLVRGVASGELMAECREATTPDCPWVPQSLRDATVVELGQNAAIAKVTTPARLTCWLALRKIGEKWLVVGQAVLENDAKALALGTNSKAPASNTAKPSGQTDNAVRL